MTGAVHGLNLPECLSALPRTRDVGSEFDVLLHGKVLFALAVAGRLTYAHFGLACQSLTWARPPPLRSWDHVLGLPALKGQAAEKVLVGNRSALLRAARGTPLLQSRKSYGFLDVGRCSCRATPRHARSGDSTGFITTSLGHATPILPFFLHNLPLSHKLSVPPRVIPDEVNPDEVIVLRGQCWYKGEWRFKTSLASPYPPLMTKLMARLINESLSMKHEMACREYTLPRSDESSQPKGWI